MANTHWTAADQAELDVLIDELVYCFFEHRETCETCRTPFAVCPQLRTAIEVVLDWRRRRELLTRAELLRVHQEIRNAAA